MNLDYVFYAAIAATAIVLIPKAYKLYLRGVILRYAAKMGVPLRKADGFWLLIHQQRVRLSHACHVLRELEDVLSFGGHRVVRVIIPDDERVAAKVYYSGDDEPTPVDRLTAFIIQGKLYNPDYFDEN